MVRIIRAGLVLAIGPAIVLSSGCGTSSGPTTREGRLEVARAAAMEEVGKMLQLRKSEANRPPAQVNDLARYEPGFPVGFRRLNNGEIVVMLGAPVEEGSSESVLAYEKQAPESGGYVLMQDGKTVKELSSEEFRAAARAPGTPSPDHPAATGGRSRKGR